LKALITIDSRAQNIGALSCGVKSRFEQT
jgi:hypothetical protein